MKGKRNKRRKLFHLRPFVLILSATTRGQNVKNKKKNNIKQNERVTLLLFEE